MSLKEGAASVLSLIVAATLTACGGGDGTDIGSGGQNPGSGSGGNNTNVVTKQGIFLDGPVAGLAYNCGAANGFTDSNGTFNYEINSTCTFRIGAITIGSAKAAPVLTPVSLVNNATNETNPIVSNISRFLQSLDNDNNPENGIVIDSSIHNALRNAEIDFSSANFQVNAQSLITSAFSNRLLVSEAAAQAHLRRSILNKMAGNYDCNYNGTDRGSASIVLSAGDDRGTVSGVGRSSIFGTTFAAFGYYESSGESSFTLGGATTGASFSGNVNIADGSGSGTWVNYPASGTWTCKKVIN